MGAPVARGPPIFDMADTMAATPLPNTQPFYQIRPSQRRPALLQADGGGGAGKRRLLRGGRLLQPQDNQVLAGWEHHTSVGET